MNALPSWLSRRRDNARAPIGPPKRKSALPPGVVAMHTMLEADWTLPSFSALARQGFMRNPIVHRCVRMISEAAAAVPWLAYSGDNEVRDHPLLATLDRPNAHQSQGAFIETVYGYLLLSGNVYVERSEPVGGRVHLHCLRPDRVRLDVGDDGWPTAIVHETRAGSRRVPFDDGDPVARILHLSLFNPLHEAEGFAPLEAALTALDIHNAAARWNKALLDNAARPSGALVYAPGDGSNLTPEQYEQLKKELEEGYSGAMNAGRPLLLEGGLDWKAMGLSPRDMDFIEAKNAASRDIALAFGVPPMLLGIPGDNTYSNYQEAQRAFYRLTVLPLVRRTTEAFGHWLSPLHHDPVRLGYDLDRVESLSTERDALWARLEAASFLTEAEKRVAVGYSPRPDNGANQTHE